MCYLVGSPEGLGQLPLPSPPHLAQCLGFPEWCHRLHPVGHLETLLSRGSAPSPGLAHRPVGKRLWFLPKLQRFFPPLCQPSSLILGLSVVGSHLAPRRLLPTDAPVLELHSRTVRYRLTGAWHAASTWKFLLGGQGPEAHPG